MYRQFLREIFRKHYFAAIVHRKMRYRRDPFHSRPTPATDRTAWRSRRASPAGCRAGVSAAPHSAFLNYLLANKSLFSQVFQSISIFHAFSVVPCWFSVDLFVYRSPSHRGWPQREDQPLLRPGSSIYFFCPRTIPRQLTMRFTLIFVFDLKHNKYRMLFF